MDMVRFVILYSRWISRLCVVVADVLKEFAAKKCVKLGKLLEKGGLGFGIGVGVGVETRRNGSGCSNTNPKPKSDNSGSLKVNFF